MREYLERQNVIEELHSLGFFATKGMSYRDLKKKLALLQLTQVEVRSPHNSWF